MFPDVSSYAESILSASTCISQGVVKPNVTVAPLKDINAILASLAAHERNTWLEFENHGCCLSLDSHSTRSRVAQRG
ncbi:hypothetical protein BC628DRAFT_1384586 [Trametes gibbosa]|nr:hypothetical protein BC628DRAFT_1384586 [Trametes gibbosa]